MEEYNALLERIWESHHVTNQGPMVDELEEKLSRFLGVKNVVFTSNGTSALQIAMKALRVTGEVITTPFSYAATTQSILWENCKPVFADIEKNGFNIDPRNIESLITPNTTAILATHVYGRPCDNLELQRIAHQNGLKLIYDGAQAFGVKQDGKSILSWGDASIVSFHATKVYHTIEGGAIVTNNDALAKELRLNRAFGHEGDNHISVGINGKNSEMHAAMGLCLLPYYDELLSKRRRISEIYEKAFSKTDNFEVPRPEEDLDYNYAYFPLLMPSEPQLLEVKDLLYEKGINVRRYFYPSLNTLSVVEHKYSCPQAESIARRIICIPLYPDLEPVQALEIAEAIVETVEQVNNPVRQEA